MDLFSFGESGALQELANKFMSGVPGFLSAVVIIILGFIISKVVANVLRKFLGKIGIDKIGEKLNEIDIVDKANIKIKISTLLSKVLYYFLILFFMVAATDVLGMPAVSNLVVGIFNLIPSLIVALIILIVGTLLADALKNLAQTTLESLGIPSARLIAMFLFYFLFINIVIVALTQAQVNTDFLAQNISLVIAGVVLAFSIGYGLASKTAMSNFLASYYTKNKIRIGDRVTIDNTKGKVVDMDKSSITVLSDNGDKTIFPLSNVAQNKITISN